MLTIDTSRIVKAVVGAVPKSADLQMVASRIGTVARAEWVRLAGQELRSTSQDYIDNIQEPEIKSRGKRVKITLTGALPNMVEKGWPGGDQRAFLAVAGAKGVRRAKAGHYYNIIPFRHGTPDTSGRNVGGAMPTKVYSAAQGLARGQRLDYRKLVDPEVRKLVMEKISAWHVAGRYQDLTRTGGGYFTFRVISEAVQRGWIHPGIQARRLAEKVQDFIDRIAPEIVRGLE